MPFVAWICRFVWTQSVIKVQFHTLWFSMHFIYISYRFVFYLLLARSLTASITAFAQRKNEVRNQQFRTHATEIDVFSYLVFLSSKNLRIYLTFNVEISKNCWKTIHNRIQNVCPQWDSNPLVLGSNLNSLPNLNKYQLFKNLLFKKFKILYSSDIFSIKNTT